MEHKQRITNLFNKHHDWLIKCALNANNKDMDKAEDIVQELYVYLLNKPNDKLYYNDSFNLNYLYNFIVTRSINNLKKDEKMVYELDYQLKEDEIIDDDSEDKIIYILQQLEELKNNDKTRLKAVTFLTYATNNYSANELSKKLGISQSSVYNYVNQVKLIIKSKYKQ